ncbi:hypothetical protein [Kitasatospora sp. NBC_01302]|uniref:hypothetical protein n=1 Tax=Kitasatospora sp. NBC_01302 TaxID=2903575 RepID=UPI002E14C643|nr:hypothetical protein OG294_34820 [Kitasatospora sp. NBC_01302]
MADDQLDDWLESLNPVLERLGWFLPSGFVQDFSPGSLDGLEAVLLANVPPGGAPPTDSGLVDSALGYLGEALLRVGGGHWAWDHDPDSPDHDLPLVCPDPALGLPPVSPMELLRRARRSGGSGELRRAHAALAAAVADHQAAHPGWRPTKRHTPGVDEADPATEAQDPWLTGWLAQRAAAFADWAADCGGSAAWDFSRDSIDALEQLLLGRIATAEAFEAPEQREFVAGAAWYLGEAVRRSAGGVRWQYRPVPPGYPDARAYFEATNDAWAGAPYLAQYPDGDSADPRSSLHLAVVRREPGRLRRRFDAFR